MKRFHPKGICVYIAPLKALARERLKEWQQRLGSPPLNWTVLELSGDTNHDQSVLRRADVLVCTPEKWDLISRSWRGLSNIISSEESPSKVKDFVFRVRLLVLDEVHLLGEERGAVLEAIVSRTRFISRYADERNKKSIVDDAGSSKAAVASESTRIIGLSTALANPGDLADWIGIDMKSHGPKARRGLYNFRPSVRPVPTKVSTTILFDAATHCFRLTILCTVGSRTRLSGQALLSTDGHHEQTLLCGDKRAVTSQTCSDFCCIASPDSFDGIRHY